MAPDRPGALGDMGPDEFRRHGHALIDWVAAYLSESDRYPVLSHAAPGEIRGSQATSGRAGCARRRAPRAAIIIAADCKSMGAGRAGAFTDAISRSLETASPRT